MKNTQQIIDSLPEQAKRDVLFALVGSLNASIIGTASSVASRLERGDTPVHELEVRDVETMLSDDDVLPRTRRMMRVASNLRDQLLAVSNDDAAGALYGTLDFMTSPNRSARKLDTDLFNAVMESAGLKGMDINHFQALSNLNDAQRAERLASQRGVIEWLLDNVLSSYSHSDIDDKGRPITVDDSEDNMIEYLHAEAKDRLFQKIVKSLERSRDNTIVAVLNRDTRYTLSDIPLIAGALEDAKLLDAHNDDDYDLNLSNGGVAPNKETKYRAEKIGDAVRELATRYVN